MKFCFICHVHLTSHQPTTSSSSVLTAFCREKQQDEENAFQGFVKSQRTDFYATGINKLLFLLGKTVLIVTVPVLTNKDVFEPSYNDLKRIVQNCDYFCTKLMGARPLLTGPGQAGLMLPNTGDIPCGFGFLQHLEKSEDTWIFSHRLRAALGFSLNIAPALRAPRALSPANQPCQARTQTGMGFSTLSVLLL